MGTYVVTGSYSGMGKSAVSRLVEAGHRVITVDQAGADVVADLSTREGRVMASAAVLQQCDGVLDGAVMAAGVGPDRLPADVICQINYLGVVELLEAWRGALAAGDAAKVVIIGSNSSTTTPLVPKAAISALLRKDVAAAARKVSRFGSYRKVFAYAASKTAVTRWARSEAVKPEWAGAGIRLNVIAPGAIATALLERQLASGKLGKQVRRFPVPIGGFGDAEKIGDWIVFMLSPAANFLCGSVIVVDGGTEAWFRAKDWPQPVPARGLLSYFRRSRQFRGGKR